MNTFTDENEIVEQELKALNIELVELEDEVIETGEVTAVQTKTDDEMIAEFLAKKA